MGVLCCAAISQRHVLESAHELHSQQEELQEMLLEFFEQHLQEHFPETDYTFDVYITTAGRVRSQHCLPRPAVNAVSDTYASIVSLHPHDLAESPQLTRFVCAQDLCQWQGWYFTYSHCVIGCACGHASGSETLSRTQS